MILLKMDSDQKQQQIRINDSLFRHHQHVAHNTLHLPNMFFVFPLRKKIRRFVWRDVAQCRNRNQRQYQSMCQCINYTSHASNVNENPKSQKVLKFNQRVLRIIKMETIYSPSFQPCNSNKTKTWWEHLN